MIRTYHVFAPDLVASVEARDEEEAKKKAEEFCKLIGRELTAVAQQ
jgi:hypothetical protein